MDVVGGKMAHDAPQHAQDVRRSPSSSASRTTRIGTPQELVELLRSSAARKWAHASTSATTSRCSNRRWHREHWRRSPSRRISRTWRSSRPRRDSDCLKCRLGDGIPPLAEIIATCAPSDPDVPMCLEMITRDPLPVPYKTDRYWVAIDRPAPDVLTRFEQEVLGKAWTRDLPAITACLPRRRSPPKTRMSGDRSTTPVGR